MHHNNIIVFLLYFISGILISLGAFMLIKNAIFYGKTAYYGPPTSPKRRKEFFREITISLPCLIIGFIIFLIVYKETSSHDNLLDAKTGEVIMTNEGYHTAYNEAAKTSVFESEAMYNNEVIWETLFDNYMHYGYYEKWSSESSTMNELRTQYHIHFRERRLPPNVNIEDVQSLVNQFGNTEIFPDPAHTLEEIDKQIPPLNIRINADPSIATEEFLLRITDCTNSSSQEALYQAGRAIDDAYKQKIHQNKLSTKEAVLFPAISFACYELSLQAPDSSDDFESCRTDYKAAELGIHMKENLSYIWEDVDRELHILLCVEAKLMRIQDSCKNSKDMKDINTAYPYFSYYLAQTQYELIHHCNPTTDQLLIEELTNECINNCQIYINSDCNTNEKCVESCKTTIQKLTKKHGVYTQEQ